MTETAITNISQAPIGESHFNMTQIELIKATVCRGSTDDELRLFLTVAQSSGLDPFTGQIHAVKRWDSAQKREVMAIQTGIDGYRLNAQRSGEYEGQIGPQWCGPDGIWLDVWTEDEPPVSSRVGVHRNKFREAVWGVARFDGYVSRKKDGTPVKRWRTDPSGMIAKCAEALALRKAFPRELSGIYCDVEMEQADQAEGTPTVQMPARSSGASDACISDKQAKRFFAICGTSAKNFDSVSVNDIARSILSDAGLEHSADITRETYEAFCSAAEKWEPPQA